MNNYAKFIMFLGLVFVPMCAMEDDENQLVTYDSKVMAQEATLRVWGAEHSILEERLTEKFEEMEKKLNPATCTQDTLDSTWQLRLKSLQALKKTGVLNDADDTALRRMVIHELLLDGARNNDRIQWDRAHSLLLGAAGITCAIIGYCVCKCTCDC